MLFVYSHSVMPVRIRIVPVRAVALTCFGVGILVFSFCLGLFWVGFIIELFLFCNICCWFVNWGFPLFFEVFVGFCFPSFRGCC